MNGLASGMTVGCVRVRRAGSTTVAQRVVDRLGTLDPDPPGPPAEVLIIRRLTDPMPGAMARNGRAWEAALSGSLAKARARAARPARGPVDPAAEAVIFADEAEALGCLLEDRVHGRALTRWWWRAFLPEVSHALLRPGETEGRAAAVEMLLSHRPELAVAILATLVVRGSAVEVIQHIAPDAAVRLARLIGAPIPVASTSDGPGVAVPSEPSASLRSGLTGPTAWLLAAALTLRTHPSAPPDTLRRMIDKQLRVPAEPLSVAPQDRPRPPSRYRRAERVGAVDEAVELKEEPPSDETRAEARALAATDQLAETRPVEPGTTPEKTTHTFPFKPGTERDETTHAPPVEPVEIVEKADLEAASQASERAADAEDGVATSLSGIFFLINLFDRSDLAPQLPESSKAGPWALLDLLARGLAGPDRYTADPIWRLLAVLDGRNIEADPDPAVWPDLQSVLPGLRDRLAAAMDVQAEAVGAILLDIPGRVFATAVHLDVVLPMAELRLPVRRAGLDFDPGYCSYFGRIVAFHYRE